MRSLVLVRTPDPTTISTSSSTATQWSLTGFLQSTVFQCGGVGIWDVALSWVGWVGWTAGLLGCWERDEINKSLLISSGSCGYEIGILSPSHVLGIQPGEPVHMHVRGGVFRAWKPQELVGSPSWISASLLLQEAESACAYG